MSRLPAFNQPENMPADGDSDVYSGSPIEPPAVTVTAAAATEGEVSSGRPSGLEEIHDDDIAQPIPFNFSQCEDDREKKRAAASLVEEKEEGATRLSGLEEIHDDEDSQPMPLNSALFEDADEKVAASTSAQQSRRSGLEEIHDDEDAQPMPFNSIQFEDDGEKKRAAASVEEATRPSGLEEIHDDEDAQPMPLNSALFEDEEIKKRAAVSAMSHSEVISSLPTPTAGVSDDGAREHDNPSSFNTTTQFEEDEGEDTNVTPTNQLYDEEAVQVTRNNNTSSQGAESVDNYAGGIVDSSVQVIPHAYLVDDEDDDDNIVVAEYAELLPPWWKQRRTRGMFAAIVLVLLTAAIAIGVLVSRRGDTGVGAAVFLTNSPTQSNAPSSTPSSAPTDSVSPSSSPTLCSDTITANTREVDLNLFVGSLKDNKVAIDEGNMVIVSTDSGYAYITFYKKSKDGEWTRTRYFVEECQRRVDDVLYQCSYSVALSGNVAMVAFQIYLDSRYAEFNDVPVPVSVYEQSARGQWNKVDSLPVPDWSEDLSDPDWAHGVFGKSVGIDGDLVCVTAERRYVRDNILRSVVYPSFFIFRRMSGRWQLVENIFLGERPEKTTYLDSCELSGDSIVGLTHHEDKIYHYQFDRDSNGVAPIQGHRREGLISERSLEGNYLVFSTYYEDWEQGIRLTHYDTVFIYKREDKKNQTFVLHQYLKSSDYEGGFGRALDLKDDTLVVSGNNRTYIFLDHGDFFEESITLDKAYTSVQISNRNVIATNDADKLESFVVLEDCTQLFPTQTPSLSAGPSITQTPSASPSQEQVQVFEGVGYPQLFFATTRSPSPTTSSRPSMLPSLSNSPTEECFMINIAFSFDEYPEQTSWTLLKLAALSGDKDTVINSYRPLPTDKGHTVKFCLEEGRYQFIVQDFNGICCDDGVGSYNITSYGALIVRGGKFDREETRTFDLPFDTNLTPSQSPSVSLVPSVVPTKSLDPTKKPSFAPSNSQVPSRAPSTSPTPVPTKSHPPSQSPSLSLFPTETCYWLKLMVIFDEYESETTWELLLTSSSSAKEYIFVNSTELLEGVYDGSLCLPKGQYKFTIYDSYGDGVCCENGEGSYNLTSYGEVIVQGGAFGTSEMTTFDIPHDPSSVITESTTAAPTPMAPTYPPTPIF